MADLNMALSGVLEREGGLADDPLDRGGLTKYGISHAAFPAIDILHLTVEQARQIYRAEYWEPLKLDDLMSQALAEKVFDMAVNMGKGTAAKMLQMALKILHHDNIVADGIIGPKTVAAANQHRPVASLLNVLTYIRVKRYLSIVGSNPSQGKFLNGWLARS